MLWFFLRKVCGASHHRVQVLMPGGGTRGYSHRPRRQRRGGSSASSLAGDPGMKPSQHGEKRRRVDALAAHACVDFNRTGKEPDRAPAPRPAASSSSRCHGSHATAVSRSATSVAAWPGKIPPIIRTRTSGHRARAATPSSTEVTPSQPAPARTAAGAQSASECRKHRP